MRIRYTHKQHKLIVENNNSHVTFEHLSSLSLSLSPPPSHTHFAHGTNWYSLVLCRHLHHISFNWLNDDLFHFVIVCGAVTIALVCCCLFSPHRKLIWWTTPIDVELMRPQVGHAVHGRKGFKPVQPLQTSHQVNVLRYELSHCGNKLQFRTNGASFNFPQNAERM